MSHDRAISLAIQALAWKARQCAIEARIYGRGIDDGPGFERAWRRWNEYQNAITALVNLRQSNGNGRK